MGAFHPDPTEHVVVGLLEHGEVLVAKGAKFVRCARATRDGLAAHRTRIGRDGAPGVIIVPQLRHGAASVEVVRGCHVGELRHEGTVGVCQMRPIDAVEVGVRLDLFYAVRSEALLSVHAHEAIHQVISVWGDGNIRVPRDLTRENAVKYISRGISVEGRVAMQELEENHADGPPVHAKVVHAHAENTFWGQVVGCADDASVGVALGHAAEELLRLRR